MIKKKSTLKHNVSKKQDYEKGLVYAWGDYLYNLGKHDKRKMKQYDE